MLNFRYLQYYFLSWVIWLSVNSFSQINNQKAIFIEDLMTKMTIDEKIGQLNLTASGDVTTGQISNSDIGLKIKNGQVGALLNVKSVAKIKEVQRIAVEESRLHIPLLFGMDVIHGYQTTFPIPLALASSWDMNLIEKSARIAAQEASADGINWTYSPMVDIARDPRWGRIAEGAGEDPYLGSRIAAAYVRGYQGNDLKQNNTILSCVKHFALYGAAEAGLDYNTTDMSFVKMYNDYLPPYQAAIDAGAGSVMTSFNEINGIPASANKWLLTELLRNQWGFKGFVVTDYTSINEMTEHGIGNLQTVSALALQAGVDLDMVGEGFLSTIKKSLNEGKITEKQIDNACKRILEAKYDVGLFENPYLYCDENRATHEIATTENMQIARKVASQTFVLLKNDNQLLPLKKEAKIALIGPLAHRRFDMAGMWSVAAHHDESVTVLEGFQNVLGHKATLQYAKGCNLTDDSILDQNIHWGKTSIDSLKTPKQLLNEALKIAKKSDVIVAVMGEGAEMSGECASRTDLNLPESQQILLKELVKLGKPIVLVLFAGRPLTINWEKQQIPAILNVWFGGTQAGNAIADAVFGDVNPSGKLTVTFPQNVGQIPMYYAHKNTGRPVKDIQKFEKFTANYLDVSNEPLYPFGYGLSYTQFEYSNLKLSQNSIKRNEYLTITVDVQNVGNFDGKEVVQLYLRDVVGSITRPVKELKGFQKIELNKGEKKTVTFTLNEQDLKFYNAQLDWVAETGTFQIFVGTNSQDVLQTEFELVD